MWPLHDDFIPFIWLLHDDYMTITWPADDHGSILWRFCDDHVSILWRLCVDYVSILWRLCVNSVTILCRFCDDHVSILWRSPALPGVLLASEAVPLRAPGEYRWVSAGSRLGECALQIGGWPTSGVGQPQILHMTQVACVIPGHWVCTSWAGHDDGKSPSVDRKDKEGKSVQYSLQVNMTRQRSTTLVSCGGTWSELLTCTCHLLKLE